MVSRDTAGSSAGQVGGALDPAMYVAVLSGLARHQLTGRLELRRGHSRRQLWFVDGTPVAFRSNHPKESLARTLEHVGMLPAVDLVVREYTGRGDVDLENVLLATGTLSREQLEEHHLSRLKLGLAASLRWASGEWTFQSLGPDISMAVDSELMERLPILPALWRAAKRHLPAEVARTLVDEVVGPVRLGADFELLFPQGFGRLAGIVGNGVEVEELLARVKGEDDAVLRMVWVLLCAGCLERSDQPALTPLDPLVSGSDRVAPLVVTENTTEIVQTDEQDVHGR
ncbi:MAG: hypothetical protein QGG40_01070 [Myxococcota bacterium]|nr:hypothetical protein [Myxococcota bacterium]